MSIAGVDFPADLSTSIGMVTNLVGGMKDSNEQPSGANSLDTSLLQNPKYLNGAQAGNGYLEPVAFWDAPFLSNGQQRRLQAPIKSAINDAPTVFTTPLPITVARVGGKGWNTDRYALFLPIGYTNISGGSTAAPVVNSFFANQTLATTWASLPRSAALTVSPPGQVYAQKVFFVTGDSSNNEGPVMGRCWYGMTTVGAPNLATSGSPALDCQYQYASYFTCAPGTGAACVPLPLIVPAGSNDGSSSNPPGSGLPVAFESGE